MDINSFNIDGKTKKKIEEIMEKKGFKNINEFIVKTIEDEIIIQEEILESQIETYQLEKKFKEGEIIDYLSKLSSKLKKISDYDEKLKLLIELDDFLIKNKEIIKETCPNMLVSILNSL